MLVVGTNINKEYVTGVLLIRSLGPKAMLLHVYAASVQLRQCSYMYVQQVSNLYTRGIEYMLTQVRYAVHENNVPYL
jgi:hypothetical protein